MSEQEEFNSLRNQAIHAATLNNQRMFKVRSESVSEDIEKQIKELDALCANLTRDPNEQRWANTCTQLKKALDEAKRESEELRSSLKRSEESRGRLLENLSHYGNHTEKCRMSELPVDGCFCSCGFKEALEREGKNGN